MRVATGFTQYRGGELASDPIIHTIGNFAGVVGSVMLVGISARSDPLWGDRPLRSKYGRLLQPGTYPVNGC